MFVVKARPSTKMIQLEIDYHELLVISERVFVWGLFLKFIYLFIFGSIGSSLLHAGFL